LSRANKPKQFQEFAGRSLLRLTVERLAEHVPRTHIYVSTTQALKAAVLDAGCDLDEEHLIVESAPAGPATAVALASARVRRDLGDVPTLICPSDHYFASDEAVHDALHEMFTVARAGDARPVVMGVPADEANPRLGYLRVEGLPGHGALDVAELREKPSVAVANTLLADGSWYWNTACYLLTPSSALGAYRASYPETIDVIVAEAAAARPYDGPVVPGHELLPFFEASLPPRLVPLKEGWSDVGNWKTFLAASGSVEASRHGDVLNVGSTRTLVFNETNQAVVTLGTRDLVVIVHADAVYVVDRDLAEDPDSILKARNLVVDQGMETLL
jgi:mannose-1-phosphate guanylyltransferase